MKTSQHDLLEAHIFNVLSATWVFVCNDENPIVTYEGIRHRLNLDSSFNVRSLVQSRGDLFRRGVPTHRLEEWKQDMRAGRRIPSWIQEITQESLRKQTIDALSPNDVFRSQFRAHSNSPKSSLEIIDWGLQHIDRLRKARYEQREKSAKTWQISLTLAAVFLPLLSGIVTLYLTQSYNLRIKGAERDIASKIEFLKLVTEYPDKRAEILRNWKGVFPDDSWIEDFSKVMK